jgi:adenylate cyclase
MNPNICTICERAFRYVKKQRHISTTATILFADIRGYTHLSDGLDAAILGEIVSAFQDQCAEAVWAHDGIVNKQMGDGLMAIFNFPIRIERHSRAAVMAALEIQSRCTPLFDGFAASVAGRAKDLVGVGVGVHSGPVSIGEFSTFHSDFTAIGGTVNLTSRLESQAAAGEILVSRETASEADDLLAEALSASYALRGFDDPVEARVLRASVH